MSGIASGTRPAILVVEDEPILRMMAVDMIDDAGFEAVEAADAVEAVRILEDRLDIRIVFTDIDIPRGLDGIKLAACIRHRWPPIEIILTSGRFMPAQEDIPARSVFFSKPYRRAEVIEAMRRMVM